MKLPRTVPVLALLLLLAACESRSLVAPEEMRGSWRIVYPAGDGARTEQWIHLGSDGSFRSEMLWYGYHGHPSATRTGQSISEGEHRVDGDRLEVRIRRTEQWQMYAVGPNPAIEVRSDPEWTDHGTVRVRGDQLFHTTTSAPADAPITATETYQRVRR